MKKLIVEITRGEQFFIAQCKDHSNCFAQGTTIEESIKNIKEVIALILQISDPQIEVELSEHLVHTL